MIPTITTTISMTGTDSTTGQVYGISLASTYSSMAAADKRMLTLTTTQRNIIAFGSNIAQGQFTGLGGVLLINRDTTSDIYIGTIISGSQAGYHKIEPGKFFFIPNRQFQANATGADVNPASIGNIDYIGARSANGSTALLEYYLFHP